jgi:putative copper export protein/methionine-rich copper-binding protein CopC
VLLNLRRISLAAAGFALLLLSPGALNAHAKLVRSDPENGAKLDSAPQRVTLTFSERPEIALSSFRLVGPVGDTIVLSPLQHEQNDEYSLSARVPLGIVPGNYRLLWRAAGSDGHPSHGTISFFVNPLRKAQQAVRAAPPEMPVDHDETANVAVAGAIGSILSRWLSFVACFLLIGVVTFRFVVLKRMSPTGNDLFTHIASTNAATLGIAASVAGLFAAMLKLMRESSDMPDASIASMMFDSTWGWSLVLQIIGVVIAGIALVLVHRPGESQKRYWNAALAGAILVALSPSLSAHAGASKLALIAIPTDMLHVVVGGAWLGTLTVIVIVGISAALKTPDALRPGARVAEMINVFSPLALTCGAAIVLTGIGSAFIELPSVTSLWTTPYGVVLLLKLLFVALLLAAGAWNWQRMKPRLTGDNEIGPMRSSASLELTLALAVLAVTAILVALELP